MIFHITFEIAVSSFRCRVEMDCTFFSVLKSTATVAFIFRIKFIYGSILAWNGLVPRRNGAELVGDKNLFDVFEQRARFFVFYRFLLRNDLF